MIIEKGIVITEEELIALNMTFEYRRYQWIRRLISAGIPQYEIAAAFNLSNGRISQIKNNPPEKKPLNLEKQTGAGGSDDAILWSFSNVW